MRVIVLLMTFLFVPHVFGQDYSSVFGRLPLVKSIQISPDGKQVAYLRDMKEKYFLVVQNLEVPNKKPVVFALDEAKLRRFTWGNNDNIIFFATQPYYSEADYETFTMYRAGILNVQENEVTWPFTSRKFDYNIGGPRLISKLAGDKEHVLMSNYYKSPVTRKNVDVVYKVNLKNGEREEYFSRPQSGGWVVDSQGVVKLYREWDEKEDDYLTHYRIKEEHDFVVLQVKEGNKLAYFEEYVVGISEDGQSIYYLKDNEEGIYILFKAKVEAGIVAATKAISTNTTYDVGSYLTNYIDSQLVGYKVVEDFPEYVYFNRELAQIQADLKATFPGGAVKITSYSENYNRVIAFISGDQYPEQYYLYDQEQGALQAIGEGFPLQGADVLGKVERFDFVASDDKTIPGYLTLPKQTDGSKPPLIVLPHGGPEQRDSKQFDWMRQFYAANGFAVYQPNFRGSSGYGTPFIESGYGEWGKKMQLDVDEGVQALIKKGMVDNKRICVVGASYGGYVAMYSAASANSLYQCAVSFAGVAELGNVFYHASEQLVGLDYWKKSIGDRYNKEELDKYSPLVMAGSNTLPLLLMHGTKDTVVPSYQSEKMMKKLKKVGAKGSRYIELEGEDHWLSSGVSRQQFLKESLEFINKHIDD